MRVCPSCGLKVNNDLSNFCYSCGEKLPEQNTTLNSGGLTSIRSDLDTKQKSEKKRINLDFLSSWKVFVVGVNALSVLFLVFALGLFFRFGISNPTSSNKISPILEINNISLEKSDSLKNYRGFVLSNLFYEIAPLNIYSYSEASNSDVFLKKLLSDSEKKYLEEAFELDFDDLLVFFKPTIAYVKKDSKVYAVVIETSGFDFFERAYSKYQTNKKQNSNLFVKRIKEFLVLSNSEKFIGDFEDVSNKLQNSISTDANFKTAVSKGDSKAVYFVYSKSPDYFEKDFEKDLEVFGLQDYKENFKKLDAVSYAIFKFDNNYELEPLN